MSESIKIALKMDGKSKTKVGYPERIIVAFQKMFSLSGSGYTKSLFGVIQSLPVQQRCVVLSDSV